MLTTRAALSKNGILDACSRRAEHAWLASRRAGRIRGGSTDDVFIAGQENRWFVEGMITRLIFGLIFAAGYVALV